MDSELRKLIASLPQDDVSRREIKKIKKLLPIPSDHEVLWIQIISKGAHPAAYAITDKAFIYKATESDVKGLNAQIKEANKRNKGTTEKQSGVDYIYQIIPWEYYSPELIQFLNVGDSDSFAPLSFTIDGERIVSLDDRLLYDFFTSYNNIIMARRSTDRMIDAQNDAEDNSPALPDTDYLLQSHYCSSAAETIDDCFDNEGAFFGGGKPVMIEVPLDQYNDAKKLFAQKIREGKVSGVSDSVQAENIIKKGTLTFSQARFLAQTRKIDSVYYSKWRKTVYCNSELGLSAVASFASTFWKTKNLEEAAENAVKTGTQVYGKAFVKSVLQTRDSGEHIRKEGNPISRLFGKTHGSKTAAGTNTDARLPERPKAINGFGVQDSFGTFLASDYFGAAMVFTDYSIPHAYKLITRKISVAQFAKNMFTLTASVAGSAVGSKIGEQGSVLSKVGANAGGAAAGLVAKAFGNHLREDDIVIWSRMINEYVSIQMIDSMMSEKEQNRFMDLLKNDGKRMGKLVSKMNKSKKQERIITKYLFPKARKSVSSRKRIKAKRECVVANGIEVFYQQQ